jgi:hypothetical protein
VLPVSNTESPALATTFYFQNGILQFFRPHSLAFFQSGSALAPFIKRERANSRLARL